MTDGVRVSVVVPVYNTGAYIHDLIDSLRAQSLDPTAFEVIFVDDGSTDETPALLDDVAAETPNLHVIHQPNSGWPGRPRNVGLDAAQGRYVFFCDHDDRLDPRALERLTDFADRHGSEVVVGKIVGEGRGAPRKIFARTLVDAQLEMALLMTSLTPQKLFRREFLGASDIRFPEGKRRLEDHLFVVTAYLRAHRISVYADHTCYYFVSRDDGGNASRRRPEWHGYFGNVVECLAVVDAEAPDEETRLVMRRRWLRREAVSRLRGRSLLRRTDDRPELLAAVRTLLEQHYTAAEIDGLDVGDRFAARLLLDGRDDDLVELARWERSLRRQPELDHARLADGVGIGLRLPVTSRRRFPPFLADPPPGYPSAPEAVRLLRAPVPQVTAALRPGPAGAAEIGLTVTASGSGDEARVDLRLGEPATLGRGEWTVVVALQPPSGSARTGDADAAVPLAVPSDSSARVDPTESMLGGHRMAFAVTEETLRLSVDPPASQGKPRSIFERLTNPLRRTDC